LLRLRRGLGSPDADAIETVCGVACPDLLDVTPLVTPARRATDPLPLEARLVETLRIA